MNFRHNNLSHSNYIFVGVNIPGVHPRGVRHVLPDCGGRGAPQVITKSDHTFQTQHIIQIQIFIITQVKYYKLKLNNL